MIKDFENVKTQSEGVHLSRYIISWLKSGGDVTDVHTKKFEGWLIAHGLNSEERSKLKFMMDCGRMELEDSAKAWINEQIW